MKKNQLLIGLSFIVLASACTKSEDQHIYTLYSTNFPTDSGRSGIATFDLVTSEQAGVICQEAADLYTEDFQKRKKSTIGMNLPKFAIGVKKVGLKNKSAYN